MKTGEIIRTIRKEQELSQIELAQKAGIAVNSVRLYESGKREPKIGSLRRIAQALGVDVYSLADFDTATQLLEGSMNAKLERLSPKEQTLILAFDQLNDAGQDKVIERAEELLELPKYKNAPSD
jgi:transcriptional regulator with XRE-family HTH domain